MSSRDEVRTVIIGIDGVPHGQIRDLADRGVMPNLRDIFAQGDLRPMRSSIPDVSSVSWSTIITGRNPGEHGVFGFTHIIPGTYTMSFPNFQALKAPPFWRRGDDRRYVIVNVPFTYPAAEINGFLVAGFVALDLKRAVYPETYLPTLEGMEYEIDVDAEKWNKSKDLFMRELFRTLENRVALGRHMWEDVDWDTFMFVFTGSDRIGHLLWHAYEDPGNEFHEDFLRYYGEIDEAIGGMVDRMSEDDHLIMLSDHGMEAIDTRVNINTLLMDEGFLSFGDDMEANYRNMTGDSRAFSLDPGRIHLNRKGRFPKGMVSDDEADGILVELEEVFRGLRKDGSPVVRNVYRGRDIYSGPHMENAPDLVVEPENGFSLRSNLKPRPLFDEDRFAGMHTPEAFLFTGGETTDAMPREPTVEDVVGIMDSMQRGHG